MRGTISITGKLEAYVGKYFVSGEGLEENRFLIYFDPGIDKYEAVDTVKEKMVACMSADYEYAFVKESILQKFKKDTAEYNISIIPVKDFDEEELCIDMQGCLPSFYRKLLGLICTLFTGHPVRRVFFYALQL